MTELNIPISEDEIRALKLGDVVSINGTMLTARDAAHKYMVESWLDNSPEGEDARLHEELGKLIDGGILYHCGPVVRQDESGKWHFVAAGPTTSIREEPYEHRIIGEMGLRAVIGKGGMGGKTLEACKEHGAVYLHAVGGAASLIAQCVEEVEDVHKTEFGLPEAFWQIRVKDFRCVVTMDSHGESLHEKILEDSKAKYRAIMG
ncbi:MAG: FumA C-terminus/TtdB family hydratase beta subunit [Candidatus Krumholzibacteria bacterium]|jgi:fumarate hydratase class I|nr:FumA C-terminus/TtdB family hydratase beta subunit [Candidatus Krumholzibacteria bacterium]MDP6668333.1 FumA C-terminus/TtdB family hydratase beta subunit [Candidatus Krumholzibacteria bacterium]MDP6798090.1 FumA C-terminus/TtdB family hydratase beta subunit [Candidatus Krumholzibacteria bacterium]MDP7022137.1 FumA C-terminus/TtdB family hydratase beta subunit [Candidatus Krumholzibacteria bacterium]